MKNLPTIPDGNNSALSRRRFFQRAGLGVGGAILTSALPVTAFSAATATKRPRDWIGYTEFRTNLPGGRHANEITMRASVIRADGTGYRMLAEELVRKPNAWTQFAGWSPDGTQAIIGSGWESPENGAWEEEHKEFRFTPDGWLYDMYLLDYASGELTNVTAVERVSFYNTGLFFWPKNPRKLGFQAIIGKDSHPFSMDRDGHNKKDLTENSKEFAYGFNASPDGSLIAYHKNYLIYIANADGSNPIKVETGQPFNFVPQWSPDGQWLLFVAGEHYNCHPYIVRRDGRLLRKVADRQGYRGVVTFLDVPDFHGGSSDVPIWSPDGNWIYYSAMVKDAVELMRVSLDRRIEQLTHTSTGHLNYHPKFSADGKWLVFGSNLSGSRQLYGMSDSGGETWPITGARPGWGSMWASWRPARESDWKLKLHK